MSNVQQILSTMRKNEEEERKRFAAFVGARVVEVQDVRVGDVIAFRDRFNGNRYTGKVLGFGDGVHVGSCQMRVLVYTFNGLWSRSRSMADQVNVLPEELLCVKREEN